MPAPTTETTPRRAPRRPLRHPALAAAIAGVALFAAFPPAPLARAESQQPARDADITAMLDPDLIANKLIDLDFRGGTLAEYVQAMRRAAEPVPVNVLNIHEGEGYTLGPVQVRRITLEQAFALIPRLVQSGPEHRTLDVLRDVDVAARRTGASVYRIESREQPVPRRSATPPPLETELLSITSLIQPMDIYGRESVLSPEEVLEVLTLAMHTAAAEPKPSLQFHRRTGTLVIKGTRQQIEAAKAAREVLGNEVTMRLRIYGGNDLITLLSRREQLRELETERQMSIAEAKRAEEQSDHWQRSQAHTAPPLIAELRRDVAKYTRQAEALAEEIEDLQREITMLEARIAKARGSSPVDIEAPAVPEPALRAIARVILAADPTAAVEVISIAGRPGLRVHEIHEAAVRELITKINELFAGAHLDINQPMINIVSVESLQNYTKSEMELQALAITRAEHDLESVQQARRRGGASDHEVQVSLHNLQQAKIVHQQAKARYESADAMLRAARTHNHAD
mgnify:CR=1 FL=1